MDDLILVRATNIIPLDGVIKPLSNTPYIKKVIWFPIMERISDWVKEEGLIEMPDPSRYFEDGYYEKSVKKMSAQVDEYMPYLSDYNPYVLFSLNGLVPDDGEVGFSNNTFSNKRCVIIEPAKHHIKDIKSLAPTDTALLGDVKLSKDATILIDEDYYQELTSEEKQKLHLNGTTIHLFKGDLKNAVKKVFTEKGYQFETLSLSRSNGGYMPSSTSSHLKNIITTASKEYNIPIVLYFNIVSKKHDYIDLFPIDIMKETDKVYRYYIHRFIVSLLTYLEREDLIEYCTSSYSSRTVTDELFKVIKSAGINKYQEFIQKYNANLEALLKMKKLPTPEQIVNQTNQKINNQQVIL